MVKSFGNKGSYRGNLKGEKQTRLFPVSGTDKLTPLLKELCRARDSRERVEEWCVSPGRIPMVEPSGRREMTAVGEKSSTPCVGPAGLEPATS